MQTKTCTKCNLELPFENFRFCEKGLFKLRSICRSCDNELRKDHRLSNLDLYNQKARIYREKYKEKCNERDKKYKGICFR